MQCRQQEERNPREHRERRALADDLIAFFELVEYQTKEPVELKV